MGSDSGKCLTSILESCVNLPSKLIFLPESSGVASSLMSPTFLSPQVAGSPGGQPDLHPALGTVPPAAAGVHLAWRSSARSAQASQDRGTEESSCGAGPAEPDGDLA